MGAELFYLAKYFCDQLADVLPPLGDVGVEAVQVPAEAERNHLEVIWAESEQETGELQLCGRIQ